MQSADVVHLLGSPLNNASLVSVVTREHSCAYATPAAECMCAALCEKAYSNMTVLVASYVQPAEAQELLGSPQKTFPLEQQIHTSTRVNTAVKGRAC